MKLKNQGEYVFDVSNQNIQVLNSEDESEDQPKRIKIQLVESGWNKNNIFITENILSELENVVMTKPKLFLNHDMYAWLGRDLDGWVATFDKVWKEGSTLQGEITFTENPETVWLYKEAKRNPEQVQVSIHISAMAVDYSADGREGKKLENLLSYKSTDFVSYGAAGGKAISVLNSEIMDSLKTLNINSMEVLNQIANPDTIIKPNNNNLNPEGEDMKLDELKLNHPDLVKAIITEAFSQKEGIEVINSLKTKTADLEVLNADLSTKVTQAATDIDAKVKELEVLNATVDTLKTEKEELASKLDVFEAAKALADKTAKVEAALAEAKVPNVLITDFFKASLLKLETEEEILASIEDRKALQSTTSIINNGQKIDKKDAVTTLTEDDYINSIKGQ